MRNQLVSFLNALASEEREFAKEEKS